MTRIKTTLAAHCQAHDLPYFEAAQPTTPIPSIFRTANGPVGYYLGSPLVYCGNVRNVDVAGHTYLRHENTFIVDHQSFALDPTRQGFEDYAAQTDNRPNPYTLPGEHIFIGGAWHDPDPTHGVPNFGHFMFEYVSRLAIFDRYNLLDRPAVVYQTIPERWLDFISLAGVGRYIYADPAAPPRYENIWTASCPMNRNAANEYSIWTPAVHWLRNRLTRNADTRKRRRIYLGRGNAKWRRVANEAEVLKELPGFDIMDPTTLTAAEQVQWMAEAEVVVAAAGAGTIITQFCPEHCRTIVLKPSTTGGMWGGFGHAIVLGQNYTMLDCKTVEGGPVRENATGGNELADIVVDIEMLRKALG